MHFFTLFHCFTLNSLSLKTWANILWWQKVLYEITVFAYCFNYVNINISKDFLYLLHLLLYLLHFQSLSVLIDSAKNKVVQLIVIMLKVTIKAWFKMIFQELFSKKFRNFKWGCVKIIPSQENSFLSASYLKETYIPIWKNWVGEKSC